MNEKERKHSTYQLAFNISIIAGIFTIVVSTILIINYSLLKTVDPLNNKALKTLRKSYLEDQSNKELAKQVRALDLLARKAFFIKKSQIKKGAYLLLASVLILLIALKELKDEKENIPQAGKTEQNGILFHNKIARGFIACFILLFMSASLGAAYLSHNDLEAYLIQKTKIQQKTVPKVEFASEKELKENWVTFRGLYGYGISGTTTAPQKWDGKTSKNILWKIELPGTGFNSPIIWKEKLFFSTGDKKKREVHCFHADTGKKLWTRSVETRASVKPPKVSKDTGYAAPTMATEGKNVYAIFATGDIIAFDMQGKKIWSRNLGVPDNHYGHSSSLQIYQNYLLVQFDDASSPRMLALDTSTGKTLWRKKREIELSWASPIIVKIQKNVYVLVSANPFVTCYDLKTGKEIWNIECMGGEVGPSPAYADGLVYFTNVGICLVAIDIHSGKIVWETDDAGFPDVSSPLATKEYLLMASNEGEVTLFEAKTGKILWTKEFEKGFYASPIQANGNFYLWDKMGTTFIIKPEKKFKLIEKCDLGEKVVTTPAFVKNKIYVRAMKHLFCIGTNNGK